MLVLARFTGQDILIGDNIVVRVVETNGKKVKLGIIAPVEIPVHRRELREKLEAQGEFLRDH